jgi:hypothetical protein
MRTTLRLFATLVVACLALPLAALTAAAREPAPPEARFDYLVRDDFFAGLAGDTARLERVLQH